MPRKTRALSAASRAETRVPPGAIHLNSILADIGAPEIRTVLESATLVTLPVRQTIYQPDECINEVFFPIDCVLSIVTRMKDGSQIEVGTIGREGVSALPLILGATTTANESYCQVPGSAIKIATAHFERLKETRHFRQLLDRYLQAYINMLGQLAACNRLHSVYERCSRWLLMTQDRVNSNDIQLTHQYLAMMLGSERSGVTIAAATLQKAGFITYGNGTISIIDRAGLEGASCECYEVARMQFGGLLRPVKTSTFPDENQPPAPQPRKHCSASVRTSRTTFATRASGIAQPRSVVAFQSAADSFPWYQTPK